MENRDDFLRSVGNENIIFPYKMLKNIIEGLYTVFIFGVGIAGLLQESGRRARKARFPLEMTEASYTWDLNKVWEKSALDGI